MSIDKLTKFAESLVVPLPPGMDSFESYDEIHCNFSGGKDSVATYLLLRYGYKVPKEKLILVHMRVDGTLDKSPFFDWEETDRYILNVSNQVGAELVLISSEFGLKERIEQRGMFPSSATQFCTSYQKRDVYAKWARSLPPGKYLCASGERAEESPRRAKKAPFEVYKHANAPTKKRFVDWLRPIHHLKEEQVWELMRLAGIEPHPCYEHVSRCSCKFCIFLSPTEMGKVSELHPQQFQELVNLEVQLGHTMKYEKKEPLTLLEFIKKGGYSLADRPCMMD